MPLHTYWMCRKISDREEISVDSPFSYVKHGPIFLERLGDFFKFMFTEFNLDGYDALVAYVIEQSLYSERGIFVEEDHLILHLMDRHYGLTPLETYNSRNPTRVSKLFHGGDHDAHDGKSPIIR